MPGFFDENGSYFTNDEEAILFEEFEFDEENNPDPDNLYNSEENNIASSTW